MERWVQKAGLCLYVVGLIWLVAQQFSALDAWKIIFASRTKPYVSGHNIIAWSWIHPHLVNVSPWPPPSTINQLLIVNTCQPFGEQAVWDRRFHWGLAVTCYFLSPNYFGDTHHQGGNAVNSKNPNSRMRLLLGTLFIKLNDWYLSFFESIYRFIKARGRATRSCCTCCGTSAGHCFEAHRSWTDGCHISPPAT